MSSSWNLSQQEAQRAALQRQLEDEEALRLARRQSRWLDVRIETSFTERSRRKRPGTVKTSELYLREDIHCGVDACPRCEAQPSVRVFRPPRRLQREHAEVIVPDAFALLQCMELLEDDDFASKVCNMLVLETVLEDALRLAPSRDATRLKNFFRDDHRRMVHPCSVVLFPNQHHAATFVEQEIHAPQHEAHVPIETQASRHRRAVAKTLAWYSAQHVAVSSRLVFLTPDVDSALSQELCDRLSIEVMTCEALIKKRFKHVDFFLELAVNTADAIREWQQLQLESGGASGEFPPHLPPAQLDEKVKSGELLRGKLDVSSHNPNEAFVRVDTSALSVVGGVAMTIDRVFVEGRVAMNRGIHGDEVVVRLLPPSEWKAPRSERVLVHYAVEDGDNKPRSDEDEGSPGDEDAQAAGGQRRLSSSSPAVVPTSAVVGVTRRSSQFFVATVLASTVNPGDDYALAIPMDKRIAKIRIRSQHMDTLLDKRLKVVVDHWPMDSMYPNGHYTAVLGETGNLSTELSAILVENEIEEVPFCEAALACLPAECTVECIDSFKIHECSTAKRPEIIPLLEWHVPSDEIARRRDLRESHRVFSVDPPGCQDIDDAMSVRRLPNGNIELGVHIADVTYFVPHDSALDFEGRTRGTTVYLVGQRLDMLPAVLSGDLCSLHEHVDRLAVSTFWELNAKTLEVVEGRTWFDRTVINSCASMTYEQAHRILQGVNADTKHHEAGKKPPHRRGVAGGPVPLSLQRELEGDLRLLTMISRKLAKARGEEGGLDLSRSEVFSLNVSELGEGGGPTGVEIVMKESLEIHGTIAELMILANGHVAKKIVDAFPSHALLRRHPPPSGSRFEQLRHIAQAKQIEIDASNNYTLQQSLVNAERSGRADAKTMALLKSLAVRVMSEAEYICANTAQASDEQAQNQDLTSFAHYGLGLQYYTHFTSPIRRYADVVVHRQLLAALELDAFGQARRILHNPKRSSAVASSGVALPPSIVPSVLEDELDALVADVDSKLHVDGDRLQEDVDTPTLLFPPEVLVPLAQHLNRKNRNAKQAARSCEELFLALYFSTHTVRTHAIITALKQNGFLVYMPTYDLRLPVYIRDRNGYVQMDPLLCGVRIVDTEPATGAFASVESIRMIPQAAIHLDEAAETLEVVAPEGSCAFHILDEVQVQVSCDSAGSNARVPQLMVQLVGRKTPKTATPAHRELTMTTNTPGRAVDRESSIPELQRIVQKRSAAEAAARIVSPRTERSVSQPGKTMYELLLPENITNITPVKKKKALLTQPAKPTEKAAASVRRRGPGRLVFGDYEPPTTKHYQQKLASYMDQRSEELEEELSIQRYGGSGVGSAEELKRMEREATTRIARLAMEKRNDRIVQRKKAGH